MVDQFDVIVLGGGIVGAATAYQLATDGLKTLLVDQFTPGHTRGSSHGDGRVVRFNYTEAIYVEMARLAYPAWERLSAAAGYPLWQKTGLLEYGPAGHEAVAQTEANLKRFGLAYEQLSAQQVVERFPQFALEEDTDIIYQPDGAVAFATPAVQALWRLAAEAGAETRSETPITQIDAGGAEIRLRTGAGDMLHASRLVITAGSWAGKLLGKLGLDIPLKVTQEVLSYYPPQSDMDHRVGKLPVMIDYHSYFEVDAPFYTLPQIEVAGVKVGWHHTGTVVDPDGAQADYTHLLDGTKRWIERIYPHLTPEPIAVQTCLYTNTPDYHFIMDRHPEHDKIVIGAGFSGHGFKFGPTLGQILAGMVQEQEAPVPLETFRLARFEASETLQKRIGA